MEQVNTQQVIGKDEGSQPISTEATKVSAEKLYTEDDLKAARLGQSKADAALNEALRILEQQKADYAESVAERDELRKEIERKEDEVFAGDTEGRSAARAKREAVKIQRELSKRQRELEQREGALTVAYKDTAIKEIAGRYGINPELLRYANSRQEAENLAVAIKAESSRTQPASGFRPDSGVSDTGGKSDDAFLRDYAAGKTDDHARAVKLMKTLK